jgi:hypothetical protein
MLSLAILRISDKIDKLLQAFVSIHYFFGPSEKRENYGDRLTINETFFVYQTLSLKCF